MIKEPTIKSGPNQPEVPAPSLSVEALMTEFNLSDSDFKLKEHEDQAESKIENWRTKAYIYRDLILALASEFSGGGFELTHSMFQIKKDPLSGQETIFLDLCLKFFDKTYAEFMQYFKKVEAVVPEELRQNFIVGLSFNYDEAGGLLITQSGLRLIDQPKVREIGANSLNKLGYFRGDGVNRAELMGNKIMEVVKQIKV